MDAAVDAAAALHSADGSARQWPLAGTIAVGEGAFQVSSHVQGRIRPGQIMSWRPTDTREPTHELGITIGCVIHAIHVLSCELSAHFKTPPLLG